MHDVGKSLATLDTRYLKLKKMWNRTVSGCISGRSEMIFFHSPVFEDFERLRP